MSSRDAAARESTNDYIYGIDIVRFVSAVSVAVFHLSWRTPETAWLMPFGWVGVQVFFVISGLVIANSCRGASARQFAVGRFLRLYPAAWCAALISFPLVVLYSANHGMHIEAAVWDALHRLLFSVILVKGPFLASAYWTLPIELSFYFLVWLMCLPGCLRYIPRLAIILILWGSPHLGALALNSSGFLHIPWVSLGYGPRNMSLLRHGPYFGLGILIWILKEKRIGKIGIFFMGSAIILGLIEIYARAVELAPNFAHSPIGPQIVSNSLALTAGIAFCTAFCAILLSVKFNRLFPANPAVRTVVRLLGLTTYPFYLLHETLGGAVLHLTRTLGLNPLSGLLIAILCIAAISLLIAEYAEPRLRNVLKRTVGGTHASPRSPNRLKPSIET